MAGLLVATTRRCNYPPTRRNAWWHPQLTVSQVLLLRQQAGT